MIKNVKYENLFDVMCSSSKSTFLTHNKEVWNNQIPPRFFDCMIGDIILFVDDKFDSEHKFVDDNKELVDFMYVKTPEEFKERVDMIANNENLYKRIKYLQRLSVYNKFKDYINKDNLEIWKTNLNI